jgi:hypothetical protein
MDSLLRELTFSFRPPRKQPSFAHSHTHARPGISRQEHSPLFRGFSFLSRARLLVRWVDSPPRYGGETCQSGAGLIARPVVWIWSQR